MTQPSTLGERLRCKRREKKWTQEQLAVQAGTNQPVIQKIENNRSLRPRKIAAIAKALGCSPSWLMYGEQPSELSHEAIQVAEAWAKLPEPHQLQIKAEIFHLLRQQS